MPSSIEVEQDERSAYSDVATSTRTLHASENCDHVEFIPAW
jgi:hypothetical protein